MCIRDRLKRMIENHAPMYFNAIECDGELSGMFVYWDMGDFYYLEHLAVFPEMRNKKIGQQVLDYVAEHLKGVRPVSYTHLDVYKRQVFES